MGRGELPPPSPQSEKAPQPRDRVTREQREGFRGTGGHLWLRPARGCPAPSRRVPRCSERAPHAMDPPEEVRARLERCGQGHLLRFWAELDTAQRGALLAALPPGLGEHCRLAAAAGARQRGPHERLDGRMEPLPPELLGSARRSGPAALQRWEAEGERGARPPVPSVPGLPGSGAGVRGRPRSAEPRRCGTGTAPGGTAGQKPPLAVAPRSVEQSTHGTADGSRRDGGSGKEEESRVTTAPRPLVLAAGVLGPGSFGRDTRVLTLRYEMQRPRPRGRAWPDQKISTTP